MSIDKKYLTSGLIGLDEVGRGPLAGPVIACGVRLWDEKIISHLALRGVTDSKKLGESKRVKLLDSLEIDFRELTVNKVFRKKDFEFYLSEVDHKIIDQINILQASLLAMKNCFEALYQNGDFCLIDGNKSFAPGIPQVLPVVKGDSKSQAIGLASIIAKQFRDELMKSYDELYPGYGLKNHAGYPTKSHKEAIAMLGISPIHRRSFKGVKEYVQRPGI